jgi:OmpA-OmpF porin, OOP family
MRMGASVLLLAASILSLTTATVALAQTGRLVKIGDVYRPVPDVVPELAQIVYFRGKPSSASARAAHVYVNGELEGALMPNGYTQFCVKKGAYSIEAYVGDEPLYAGKTNPKTEVNLEGGKTYFVGVSENGSGEPVPYRRAEAEQVLKTSLRQINVINRAGAVVPCSFRPDQKPVASLPPPPPLQFRLDAQTLFAFGQSSAGSLTPAGRNELAAIARKVLALPPNTVTRLSVVGYTDPIGAESYNLALSEKRAQAVGEVLSQSGIPKGIIRAIGMGSVDPVVTCPSKGDKAEQIRCNAPNRRVEIAVERNPLDNEVPNR